jgi:hypothetical protein
LLFILIEQRDQGDTYQISYSLHPQGTPEVASDMPDPLAQDALYKPLAAGSPDVPINPHSRDDALISATLTPIQI